MKLPRHAASPRAATPDRHGAHGSRTASLGLGLLQLLQDGLLEGLGLGGAGPAALDLAVAADEELLKVPLDELEAHDAGLLRLEPGEEGLGVVAVDVGLLHDGEGDAVVELAEALDVVVGAGLLATELVAGEAEDGEVVGVLLLELLVESLKAGILGSEAALGGGVDDEDDLALVLIERVLLAALCTEGLVSREGDR
jgi:hypothetical protein